LLQSVQYSVRTGKPEEGKKPAYANDEADKLWKNTELNPDKDEYVTRRTSAR
jgi:hypothetical protein